MLSRYLKAVYQNSQSSPWLHVCEGMPQGLPFSCMLFVLYLDECLREINKVCDQSYSFVDDSNLLVIQKEYENRNLFVGSCRTVRAQVCHDSHTFQGEIILSGGIKFVASDRILGIVVRRPRPFLLGLEIIAFMDHSSLSSWETKRSLSGRIGPCTQALCRFAVEVMYCIEQRNILANALSPRLKSCHCS
jgi:hypothetical protein